MVQAGAPVKSRASVATAEHATTDLTPNRRMKTGQDTSAGGSSPLSAAGGSLSPRPGAM